MPDMLNPRKSPDHSSRMDLDKLDVLEDMIRTAKDKAKAQANGEGARPVEKWHPERVADMDLIIRADGSWWHEGSAIKRRGLVKLFASILRKDADGQTYLVTPAEKLRITVERAHFIATGVTYDGEGKDANLYFSTNMDEVVALSPERPLRVKTHSDTGEPIPLLRVRGRLDALLSRPVFYDVVDHAVEMDVHIDGKVGKQLGIYAGGNFYPLGPVNGHLAS